VEDLHAAVGTEPELDSPLFPTLNGEVASKTAVVQTFEALATNLELPLERDGARLFGGHTARVSGAQFLAGIGLEVPKIQLLARWASLIVLRYVAEAPLAAITDNMKTLLRDKLGQGSEQPGRDQQQISEATQSDVQNDILDRLRELEAKVASRVPIADEIQELPKPDAVLKMVVNDKSRKIHQFVVRADAHTGRTCCGWKFDPSQHSTMDELPDGVLWHEVCDWCMPDRRTELLYRQGGDGDSSVDASE